MFERVADRFNVFRVATQAPILHELHEQAQVEFEELKHKFLMYLDRIINHEASPPEQKGEVMSLAREIVSEVLAMVKHDILAFAEDDERMFEFVEDADDDDDEDIEEAMRFLHRLMGKCEQILEFLKAAIKYFKLKLRNEPLSKLSWNRLSDMRRFYDFIIIDQLPAEREYIYTYAHRRRIVRLSTLLKNHYTFQYYETQYKIRKSAHWKPAYDMVFTELAKLQQMKAKISTERELDTIVSNALTKLQELNDALTNAFAEN